MHTADITDGTESGPMLIFCEMIGAYVWGVRVRFGVRAIFSVKVNCFRDSFSAFIHAQQYSMLTVRHRNHTLYFTGS